VPAVIGIQEGHEFAGGIFDPSIPPCADNTVVTEVDDFDPGVIRFFDNRQSVIGGVVVHHHDLKVLECLPQHRGQRFSKKVGLVVTGDDD
jgi:hypothetical protein